MKEKVRLDMLLTERNLFPSREKARAAIMAGEVLVNEQKIDKAGTQVTKDVAIRLLGERLPFVSRGGLKLAKALQSFKINLHGLTGIDLGASTGGFTDCALQNGAEKIFAVDVGYGQLAWKIRQDERVVVLEKTNARYLTQEQIPQQVDFICADVSFISLSLALATPVAHFLKEGGMVITLIKPQFEAGKDYIGKKGIVRDPQIHHMVLTKIFNEFTNMGLSIRGLDYSPITGADGNIEYLIYAHKDNLPHVAINIDEVINSAWAEHNKKI